MKLWKETRLLQHGLVLRPPPYGMHVAQYCGFSINTFKGWMSKGIFPTVIDAYYIAKSLGVSLDYLAAGSEKKEIKNKKRIENINLLLDKAKAELVKIG